MTKKNEILSQHFEQLKALVPEIYQHQPESEDHRATKLYEILKRSLGIIEAVYLQNAEGFKNVRMEEYGKLIRDLKSLGYDYEGNAELLEKAAGYLILQNKKPMEKAKGSKKSNQERKAM
ncbi:hypothetical protein [Marinoscillum sp.]|uniref:hypothetical protein n=1 Tax=Marinoscillum sp. TaxID=2024838 RepID=UPI003BAC1D06